MGRGKASGGHRQKAAICIPQREASGEPSPADSSTLDSPPPELREHKSALLKPPGPWCSVTTAEQLETDGQGSEDFSLVLSLAASKEDPSLAKGVLKLPSFKECLGKGASTPYILQAPFRMWVSSLPGALGQCTDGPILKCKYCPHKR